MQNLYESINKTLYINQVLEEYMMMEAEETLQLNESFQASILKSLAKAIQDAEKPNYEQDKKSFWHKKKVNGRKK